MFALEKMRFFIWGVRLCSLQSPFSLCAGHFEITFEMFCHSPFSILFFPPKASQEKEMQERVDSQACSFSASIKFLGSSSFVHRSVDTAVAQHPTGPARSCLESDETCIERVESLRTNRCCLQICVSRKRHGEACSAFPASFAPWAKSRTVNSVDAGFVGVYHPSFEQHSGRGMASDTSSQTMTGEERRDKKPDSKDLFSKASSF